MQLGPEEHVASMGDLKMREDLKVRQEKLRHEKSMEKGLKYLGDGLTVATKLSGLGSSSSSKQSGLLLSAVSAGLNLGSSAMKNSRMSDQHAAAVTNPAQTNTGRSFLTDQLRLFLTRCAVYNNYYMSNDHVGAQQELDESYEEEEEDDDEPEYGEAEYEIEEEDHQGQQYIANE